MSSTDAGEKAVVRGQEGGSPGPVRRAPTSLPGLRRRVCRSRPVPGPRPRPPEQTKTATRPRADVCAPGRSTRAGPPPPHCVSPRFCHLRNEARDTQ